MQKRIGFVQLQRPALGRIFKKIDGYRPKRGPAPNVANVRLFVYTAAVHADYLDVPEQGREAGRWNTSYSEILELTGLKTAQTRQVLQVLERVGLIRKEYQNSAKKPETPQSEKSKLRKDNLSLILLFYNDLTNAENENSAKKNGETPQVFKEAVPPPAFLPGNLQKGDRASGVPQPPCSDSQENGAAHQEPKPAFPIESEETSDGDGGDYDDENRFGPFYELWCQYKSPGAWSASSDEQVKRLIKVFDMSDAPDREHMLEVMKDRLETDGEGVKVFGYFAPVFEDVLKGEL